MPSIPNSASSALSTLTWGDAKRRVARVENLTDPDGLTAAGEYIGEVLRDWNTRRDWKFLQTLADDIPLTANQSMVSVPNQIKKPYVAYLTVAARKLHYTPRRVFTRAGGDSVGNLDSGWYTTFNTETTGQIELLPPTATADNLRFWYIRLMAEDGSDNEVLDILRRYEPYILAGAKGMLCLEKGHLDAAMGWQARMEAGYKAAVIDDSSQPDFEVTFEADPYRTSNNPNSTLSALEGDPMGGGY